MCGILWSRSFYVRWKVPVTVHAVLRILSEEVLSDCLLVMMEIVELLGQIECGLLSAVDFRRPSLGSFDPRCTEILVVQQP